MKMDRETADALKLCVKRLYETQEGLLFIEFLEELGGKYAPVHDPSNADTFGPALGRQEIMQTIRNLNRYTAEEVVGIYERTTI